MAAIALPYGFPPLAAVLCARAGLAETVDAADGIGFDVAYYQVAARRKFGSVGEALFHYLLIGSSRGFGPNAGFDPAYYRRANPDVDLDGYEPFAHYSRFGRHEGRGGMLGADLPDDASVPPVDVNTILSRIRPSESEATADIVIPVHGSRPLALQTIDSVLATRLAIRPDTNPEVVVVDDASPDPALGHDLRLLADRGLITLLTNDHNVGFVASVNRGMALHPMRDIVLLNSDTKVHGDWLERLLCVLRGGARIGTATPLSNAATILSYPIPLRDNNKPMEIDYATLDQLCARLALEPVELPTAVGFCMAISRSCLDAVGPFDAARFGRGYGEENDFCLRASALGWRHLAATNVFVWHRGGASFGDEREALVAAAQATLEERHPGYRSAVRSFILRDPLRPIRAALDAARVAADSRRKILQFGRGLRSKSVPAGHLALSVSEDIGPSAGRHRIVARDLGAVPGLPRISAATRTGELVEMMSTLAIEEVRVQAVGRVARRIIEAAKAMGAEIHLCNYN